MMKTGKLIAVIGLPASGKTELAQLIHYVYGGMLLDDPSPNRIPHFGRVVVSSPFFCDEKSRNKLLEIRPDTVWVAFENNPELALKNAAEREKENPERKVLASIKHWTRNYTIPEGSVIVPVYKGDSDEGISIVFSSGILQS